MRAEVLPEPLLAADVRHGGAGDLSQNGTSQYDTLDLARAIHARRALEQALDHGTALLAALGLPPLPSMTRAIALLDAIDAPAADLEETGDDEPSLGWVDKIGQACLRDGFGDRDLELDTADFEPVLGAPEQHECVISYVGGRWHGVEPDRRRWADGCTSDREQEITDEPHDDQEDEPSLGWPEDFEAKLVDVLQADHDPELDDADLEDGDEDAPAIDDPVWSTLAPPLEAIGCGL